MSDSATIEVHMTLTAPLDMTAAPPDLGGEVLEDRIKEATENTLPAMRSRSSFPQIYSVARERVAT